MHIAKALIISRRTWNELVTPSVAQFTLYYF